MMAKLDTGGMTLEERMELAQNTAKNYYRQGLNCAECVTRTFLDMHDTGLPEEVMCISSGFGGGIGRTQNICGAITGAVIATGMVKGRRDPLEKETMADRIHQLHDGIYPVFADLIREIEGQYGTLICRDLTSPFADYNGKERKRNCMQMIGYCAGIAEKYASKP